MCAQSMKVCSCAGLPRPEGEGIGVGLDSCVMPTRHKGLDLVQTTDLYPLAHSLKSFVIDNVDDKLGRVVVVYSV